MGACNWILRGFSFALHFISAIFLTFVAIRCGGSFSSNIYTEKFTDTEGYKTITPEVDCTEDKITFGCFFGITESYDVKQDGTKINILALLAAFEWISASFALYYIRDIDPSNLYWTPFVSMFWNAAGVLIFMPYSMPLSILQTGITALSLLATTMAQINDIFRKNITENEVSDNKNKGSIFQQNRRFHSTGVFDSKGYNIVVNQEMEKALTPTQTVLHYTEYCTSASLLFLAVLMLYMPDPLSWTVITSFVSILLCNLAGIGAHYCKLDQHNTQSTPWYDLDWSKPGNHFKLFMLHSWSALLLALCVLIYNSWASLSSTDVPLFVRFTLYNLLVTYSAFGIYASICYAFSGTKSENFENFDAWMVRLDYGLTILSIAAKLPIAYAVFYGVINMPGASGTCKLF